MGKKIPLIQEWTIMIYKDYCKTAFELSICVPGPQKSNHSVYVAE
jgi:hypothetical protein